MNDEGDELFCNTVGGQPKPPAFIAELYTPEVLEKLGPSFVMALMLLKR